MGITKMSLERLEKYGCLEPGLKMLELGAQNMYDAEHYGMVAKEYFESLGIIHTSVDITPHQGALSMDLRVPHTFKERFNVITNFGTVEHLAGGLYMGFQNVHKLTSIEGVMVHENPKTGNWPGHGYHYFTRNFYIELAKFCRYDIVDLDEEAAMGNEVDGWNICAVMIKTRNSRWITEDEFKKLDVRKS